MEQFVILLVVGAIGLIKWVMEKSAEQRAQRETEERIGRLRESEPVAHPMLAPRPIAPSPFPNPATTARRLREALGLPDESDLPPRRPVAPRPLPTFRVEEVKAMVPAHDLERRVVTPPPLVFLDRLPAQPIISAEPREPAALSHSGLDELLRSRAGLRKAILVQEILGTPKGLVF